MTAIIKEQGYFRSFDGVRLYYAVEGPKDAPPLLFCYGLVCSKLQWKYQMEHFKKTHRVIYMDYRAHCQSAVPTNRSSVTIENLARDLGTLCEELNLPPLPIIGHSLGVNVILDFYRLYPDRVSALVLANGTPKDPFETMFHHNILQVFFPLILLANRMAPDVLEKFWKSQGENKINQFFIAIAGFNRKYAKQEDINEYLRLTSTVPLGIFLNLLGDFMSYDCTHWLEEVRVPTLIISGGQDLITPPINQRIMKELIPRSILETIPEGSHCPQMEQIDLVNNMLEKFLEKSNVRKTARKQLSARSSKKLALKG